MPFLSIQCLHAFTTISTHQPSGHKATRSLHAKKSVNKKKSGTAQTFKGFGAAPPPPPTFDELIARFRTRVPEDADNQPCPCGGRSDTEKLYGECCGPLHRGERLALTTTDVLRSRYVAFSWRLVEYIIKSTHKSCRDYLENKVDWANSLNRHGMFDSFDFVKLEVGPEENGIGDENEGYIEFSVTLRAKNDSYLEDHGDGVDAGQVTKITERSKFIRDPSTGVWSYASGDVRSGVEDVSLN
jgi:SEC-C motif-containing protein